MNRQPIHISAESAATKAYNWVATKPENARKTPAQIRPDVAHLLRRMIQQGLFVITN